MLKRTLRIPTRVIFYKEEQRWIAHCLEFDLVGDGSTKDEALRSLWQAMELQIEESIQSGNRENLFSPAESKYFEMFAAGTDLVLGEVVVEIHLDQVVVEQPETREYSDDLVTA